MTSKMVVKTLLMVTLTLLMSVLTGCWSKVVILPESQATLIQPNESVHFSEKTWCLNDTAMVILLELAEQVPVAK